MSCPVCRGAPSPQDCTKVDRKGRPVIVEGKVYAIQAPGEGYPPYGIFFTVPLSPRQGTVKYLKFSSKDELENWSFQIGENFMVRGCLHVADGKELIFNITHAEPTKKG